MRLISYDISLYLMWKVFLPQYLTMYLLQQILAASRASVDSCSSSSNTRCTARGNSSTPAWEQGWRNGKVEDSFHTKTRSRESVRPSSYVIMRIMSNIIKEVIMVKIICLRPYNNILAPKKSIYMLQGVQKAITTAPSEWASKTQKLY